MQIKFDQDHGHRESLEKYIREKKEENPDYKVIDVGGGDSSVPGVDLIADLRPPEDGFKLDVCKMEDWEALVSHIKGDRFDFAICSHTLEDVYDPFTALHYLPYVAKAGLIATPSIWAELGNPQSQGWKGYYHHKWIFTNKKDKMFIAPKTSMLEFMVSGRRQWGHLGAEIQYMWKDKIPYEIFMDNYLGPTIAHCTVAYHNLLSENGIL